MKTMARYVGLGVLVLLSIALVAYRGCAAISINYSIDTKPPVIVLNGLKTVDVKLGGRYLELRALARDEVDGRVKVLVNGVVDTKATGVHKIMYTAIDKAGNSAKASRIVVVSSYVYSVPSPVDSCKGIHVDEYGAVGDGVSDDASSINRASLVARERNAWLIFTAGKTYRVGDYIKVNNGVKGAVVCGKDRATIKAEEFIDASFTTRGFLLNPGTTNFLIEGFKIESGANGWTGALIEGRSVKKVTVRDNYIDNHAQPSSPILFSSIAGHAATEDVSIENNVIKSSVALNPDSRSNSIRFVSELEFTDDYRYWIKNHKTIPSSNETRNIQVVNNDITGGYYGIELFHVEKAYVIGNTVRKNMRSISLQQNCRDVLVENNHLLDSTSSSIHLAYGSSDNIIEGNRITTNRAVGEGLLQAYVGTNRNIFRGNIVDASASPDGPMWYIYSAINANDNVFEDNILKGPVQKSYIALEAAWDSSIPASTPHRSCGEGCDNFASENSSGNIIRDNTIDSTLSPTAALIWFAEVTDKHGAWMLPNSTLTPNYGSKGGVIEYRKPKPK